MIKIFNTIKERWTAKMPLFFKWVLGIGVSIASIALAIQMALDSGNASAPEWWQNIYPYLIGVGAGLSAAAKLTQKQ